MRDFLTVPLTAAQQSRLYSQLYSLLADQVKSYHKHYHLGNNSSVPAETARELTESIFYTVDTAGGYRPEIDLCTQLERGQALLRDKLDQALRLQTLVAATVPDSQSQCHWEAVQGLDRYLRGYDLLHFAHRIPENLDYPLLTEVPETLRGVEYALFFLKCLWLENQILQGFPPEALESLYMRMPPDYWEAPQNMCEQPLRNALARVLLDLNMDSLIMTEREQSNLTALLRTVPGSAWQDLFLNALDQVCQGLRLTGSATEYASGMIAQLLPRLWAALPGGNLSYIFW